MTELKLFAPSVPHNTPTMQKNNIHHIGIIVPDEEQADFLFKIMGLTRGHTVYVKEYEATCIFGMGEGRLLEFIVPDPGSKLSQFNQGLGGIHHIAIETIDIGKAAEYLDRELEIDFLEKEPVLAGDLLINFVPPSMTRGIIIEYVQQFNRTKGIGNVI